jgi:hypothetical protein
MRVFARAGQSICIYHNGNSRILQHYLTKFPDLKFSGNWSEAVDRPSYGHIWEICFADATRENMFAAADADVYILRHISNYSDDLENLLPECQPFNYIDWINFVVANNLCFANQVISDVQLNNRTINEVSIVTTGRTANTHLQLAINQLGNDAFEYSKQIDQRLLESSNAIFLWRENNWDCLTSTWIAIQTEYKKSHQTSNQPFIKFIVDNIPPIDLIWITDTWFNLCQLVLDHAMFYRYVCQRPIVYTTTEYVVAKFQTEQQKLNYNKEHLIANYYEIKSQYDQLKFAEMLESLYTNVTQHIEMWNLKELK